MPFSLQVGALMLVALAIVALNFRHLSFASLQLGESHREKLLQDMKQVDPADTTKPAPPPRKAENPAVQEVRSPAVAKMEARCAEWSCTCQVPRSAAHTTH